MTQKSDQLKLKRGTEKVNNLCDICEQNRDFLQPLLLLFTKTEQVYIQIKILSISNVVLCFLIFAAVVCRIFLAGERVFDTHLL